MRLYIVTLLFPVCMLFVQAAGQKADSFDVACRNLKIVPSKPHVGDRLWIRFEVVNLSAKDIPGKCVEVDFSLDGKEVIMENLR